VRRSLDVLLVAAVAAIAVVAGWDALREDETARSERSAADAAAALRDLGASGRLVVSDADCRRAHVELPSLGRTEVPRITGCRVFSQRGSLGVRGGEVAWYAFPSAGGVTELLSRAELERELAGRAESDWFVLRAAWLRSTRYAALLASSGTESHLLALFERDRLLHVLAELDGGYRELRTSRGFGYVAAVSEHGGLALYDRDGDPVAVPEALREPRSVAWSPDEGLTAVATRDGVAVFPTGSAEGPVALLPVDAHDLDWLP
jgi:hypothetical protein